MSPYRRLGALAAVLVSCSPPTGRRPETEVWVPQERIAAGSAVTQGLLKLRPVDEELAGPGALRADGGIELGVIAAIDLEAGRPIQASALAPEFPPSWIKYGFRVLNVEMLMADSVRPMDSVDLTLTLPDPTDDGEIITTTLFERVKVVAARPGATPGARLLSLMLLREEVEVMVQAMREGTLGVAIRNPSDIIFEEKGRTTRSTLFTGERINTLLRKRIQLIQTAPGTSQPVAAP